ncbi:MAG TPA: hypothetical protein ENK19_05755 [Acidobacteria bacterium]|nr:hypothetical protein [Acidobacteriota bacterium]
MDRVIRLARTMAWLRWRLLINSLRTVRGLGEAVAGALLLLLGGVFALLTAVAAGLPVFSGLLDAGPGDARVILGVAWGVIGLLAIVLPVLAGEGRAELAPRRLLQFPVSRADLFWTGMLGELVAPVNLLWYPAMAATVAAALASGAVTVLVLPVGLLVTLSILAAQQALLMGVQWLATSRRLREIATVLAIFLFVGVAQLPNILRQAHLPAKAATRSVPPVAGRILLGVLSSLPPALAAHLAVPDGALDGLTSLLGLLLWTGLALGIAWKLYLGGLERRSAAGTPSRTRGRAGLVRGGLDLLPPDLAGLAAKQLRYILRSTVGRLGLLMSPLMGLIFAFMGRNAPHAIFGMPGRDAFFLILCLMGSMYGSDVVANRFEWDGGGVALYFVAPVDPARVILGLDIGVWIYGALTAAGLLLAYLPLAGLPEPAVLLTGLLLMAGARIVYSLAGAVLSILFPVARDIGASRSRLTLVPALAMMGAMALAAAFFAVPAAYLLHGHHTTAAPVLLLVLVLVAAAAGRAALPRIGRLLLSRREQLLDAIESRPG